MAHIHGEFHAQSAAQFDAPWRFAGRAAVVLGVILRIWLAAVNQYANDDHFSVIAIIADQNRFPGRADAWEGFQPKLYHTLTAMIWKTLSLRNTEQRIFVAQFLSCAAGIATVWLAARQLRRIGAAPKIAAIALALVALNPSLISISAQATNDAFVIFFVSMTLFMGQTFFQRFNLGGFAGMSAASLLAALSKGNGLVVLVVVTCVFLTAIIYAAVNDRGRCKMLAAWAVAYVALAIVPAAMIGPYADHYRKFGSPFVINREAPPLPHLWETSLTDRPGLRSIIDGLFTFRFFDLMLHPTVAYNFGDKDYPEHLTSLWSQLYARAHSVHFGGFPPQWRHDSAWMRANIRLSLLLGLLPTWLMLAGMVRRWSGVKRLDEAAGTRPQSRLCQRLLDISVLGYFGFIVVYAVRHRRFPVMKAIFIFPALLGFLVCFVEQCQRHYAWCESRPVLRRLTDVCFALLLASYTSDVGILIGNLASRLTRTGGA